MAMVLTRRLDLLSDTTKTTSWAPHGPLEWFGFSRADRVTHGRGSPSASKPSSSAKYDRQNTS